MSTKYWLKSYPKGIPSEIHPSFENLSELIEHACAKFADHPMFNVNDETLTYKEVSQRAQWLASFYQQQLGIEKGDRVAVLMPNILAHPIAIFAAMRAGIISVGINPLYTAREATNQINDAQAETLVTYSLALPLIKDFYEQTSLKRIIVVGEVDNLNIKIPVISFQDALNQGKTVEFKKVKIKPDDIALLQYTGGTTGVSKGAMLTHSNLVSAIEQGHIWIKQNYDLTPRPIRTVTILPLYHIGGMISVLISLTEQCYNVLVPNPRDIANLVKLFSTVRPHQIGCLNTLMIGLLNHPEFTKLDFSNLIITFAGAMPTQNAVANQWQQLTGICVSAIYGLSETCAMVTIDPIKMPYFRGTVGLPVPSTEVSIRNDEGLEVPIGEPGEIWVRGPQVMIGYWRHPKETEEVLTHDGWLKTGDIGYMDSEGFLSISDRKKDMLIVSGFNVFPAEIENVIAYYPGVKEVAVIAVDDEYSGQVPKAFIVPSKPNITQDEILAYCQQKLTRYKIPKYIEFVESLPLSSVGKVLRRKLREREQEKSNEKKK